MSNDIKLKIGADTSEIEKAFGNLIKKIQGDADKLKLTPTAKSTAPGVESVQAASQTARSLDQKARQEKAGLDLINRELAKKEAAVQRIQRAQESSNKTLEREIQLKNQLARAERELEEKKNIARIQQVTYDRTIEASNRAKGIKGPGGGQPPGTGPQQGAAGFGMPAGGITSLSGLAKFLGIPGIAIGAIGTAIAANSALEGGRRFFGESQLRAREAEATAFQTQGQAGQRLQSFVNGGASEELMFDTQRAQASQQAQSAIKGRYTAGGAGSPIMDALSFALGNQGLGAIQHGQYRQAFRAIGGRLGNEGLQKDFETQKDIEQFDLQKGQFEAFKNGPEGALRTTLGNKYLRDYQRNLDFQRQTGQSEEGFRGFLGGVNRAGFTDEQGMGMSSGILGAGGSTRAATGNAALGLQAQRNLDITNASGLIGKLSGGLGGAETTKESFVKLLAEGTRAGLDGSDFREENRKFVESAADMISKSGVSTSGGVEQILSQFGRFFGDKTNTGIEAGKNAFDLYRETSMATTGPRATMRAAGMLTDPTIGKLSRDSREALFNMPIDQLTPDNPAIIAMAAQASTPQHTVSPEDLIKAQNKITSKSANLFKNSDIATQNLSKIKQKYNLSSAIGFQGPLSQVSYDEIGKALGESNIAQIKEHPELGKDQRTASAYSEGLTRDDARMQNKALEDAKKNQLEAPTTGRPGDETNRQQAEASRLANELFVSIQKSIVPASDAVKTFATDINALVAAIKSGQGTGAALKTFNDKYPGMTAPSNVPSANSPSSGGGSGR
jgi:hypothetical protein